MSTKCRIFWVYIICTYVCESIVMLTCRITLRLMTVPVTYTSDKLSRPHEVPRKVREDGGRGPAKAIVNASLA